MKVLVPYKDVDHRPFSSKIISGGIEKCIRNSLLLPGVEVAEIVGLDYEKTMMVELVDRIKTQKPDLIICHYPNPYFNVMLSNKVKTPIAWVCHHTAGFDPKYKEVIENMEIFLEKSVNSLWMVTEYQHKKWVEHGLRAKVEGYVPSSFVEKRHVPNRRVYDAMTIGRCDKDKDPFMLHRINQGIVTVVMSNKTKGEYLDQNLKWEHPTTTMWDREHEYVMHHLQYAGVYLSTWNGETFGQTALEALARGVPLVMNGDENCDHASAAFIDGNDEFGRVVTGKKLFETLVEYMGSGMATRRRIADATFEKFSFEWWKPQIENLLEIGARK